MAGSAVSGGSVPLWGRWEWELRGEGAPPEAELRLEATSPSGRAREAEGFWDGGDCWRIRFMPDEPGRWRVRTRSSAPGLDGRAAELDCRIEASANRFLRQGAIGVAEGGRHLCHRDGTPFFWLGDTAWNGPLLSTAADWDVYLRERAGKGFTAVQFVMTNWRTAAANAEGEVAFTGREAIAINPRFFRRLDARIDALNARGLLAVPVLLWAIRGEENPGWFLTEEDAARLARYMTARYGAHHVAWILPGDGRYVDETAERWKRIGRAVFGGREHAPTLLHPCGQHWPYDAFREEPWLDIQGYQSGHGDDDAALEWLHSGPPSREWRSGPARPVLNLEPPYEDHLGYQSRRPHDARSVRRAAYWSLLCAPPAGLTYGAHGIWSWETEPNVPLNHANSGTAKAWREAMALPGSQHMGHLAALFTSLEWWRLRPDTGLLAAQPAAGDPARFVAAARTDAGDLAILYLPVGGEVALRPGAIRGEPRAEWFDPRSGRAAPASAAGPGRYAAPDEQDWVLVLRGG